jgi:N-acetylmuramoyl-L-alanine amidase
MKKSFITLLFLFTFLSMLFKTASAVDVCEKDLELYKNELAAVSVFSNPVNDIYITDSEAYLMAQVVYGESGSEPYIGKVAVASVILNRVKDPLFPKTVAGVITQKGAFSCVKNGKISSIPDEASYRAVLDALKGQDPTDKAVFFYNPKTATSTWMRNIGKKNIKNIGNHSFFVAK